MPANDIDRLPRSSFHEEGRKPPLVPALIVGGAFFAGICLMTSINRAELGIIVSQFSVLWPIAQDRQEILRVFFKILLTGVVFAAIGLACSLAAYAVRSYKQDDQEEARPVVVPSTQSQAIHRAPVTVSSSIKHNALARESVPARQQAAPQRSTVQQLPFTPIPEMMMFSANEINTQIEKEHADTVGTIDGDKVVMPEELVGQQAEQVANERKSVVPSNQEPGQMDEGQQLIYITITLLKAITMALHVPGSNKVYPVTLDDLNSKALQLIAYIARHQGKKVNLGDMRNEIFGNDEMDTSQVQESLNTAKREIRRRISQAIERARSDFGMNVLPSDLDIFELAKKKYWLPAHCQVTDLAIIEEQHRIINQAENGNHLINSVPEYVYTACTALIRAYTGDFIEDLLVDDPYAFDPPTDSWVREPFTLFRDYYLQAILYAAEYERKMGDSTKESADQREHYADAGRLFALGAMAACNRRVFDGMFDTKVFFSSKPSRRHGAHVLLSEQFIRRAIALYGKIGSTILAKRVYATYEQQMHFVSNKVWSADSETLKDLEAALQQTGAYRFPDTIASPSDLSSTLVSAESA